MKLENNIPLALYIHIPWCIKKCPYCDFNSHAQKDELPERAYIERLIDDLKADFALTPSRTIKSIFIGGGTPSLFAPHIIAELLERIKQTLNYPDNIEITLEANPGTVEQSRFAGFRKAGINRISLGVQSFQADKLKRLGRIHNHLEAIAAVTAAQNAGFENINIDLMYALPEQSTTEALADLQIAISLKPTHISWYQLNIEPNTLFFHKPPTLPDDDISWEMQSLGQQLLADHDYIQYETSAYSQPNHQCQHNLNYWLFGDYLGIGAGAHGKITQNNQIKRMWKVKHPKDYLDPLKPFIHGEKIITVDELPFEFMLNVLRLHMPIPYELFFNGTGLAKSTIKNNLAKAQDLGLIQNYPNYFETTTFGKRYLNDLLEIFLN